MAGASVERSVEIACAVDTMSGGTITVEHLTPVLKEVA
jgi:hypothetical protein